MCLSLDREIGGLNNIVVLFMAVILVAFIGICDYKTEENISFYVFYSIPIFIASWYIGGWAGIIVSFASSMAWWLVDFKNNESSPLVLYLDTLLRLVFFVGISFGISFLHGSFEREKNSAHTDFLTGLPNRRTFIERISAEIERAKRYNRSITIAYIDLDNFKTLNDRYGHAEGDKALQKIASTLRLNIRTSDFAARMGGDEFIVFLPETNDTQAVSSLMHLHSSLNQVTQSQQLQITFTIGAVTYDKPTCSPEEMIKAADRIMYSAKRAGKNTIKHMNANELVQTI
ncbi:MAG TPA: GGDEF domain-containing protein [Acidobacteriota bacterium]|nr:GGDEF domain-containing protein [Acidobacteriota bacterium]